MDYCNAWLRFILKGKICLNLVLTQKLVLMSPNAMYTLCTAQSVRMCLLSLSAIRPICITVK